jgi:hypothetical protein
MVELKGLIAKFIKNITFKVESIEDDSSENAQVLRVKVSEQITVTGSQPLSNGGKMVWKDDVIYVGPDDIEAFQKGLKEDGTYEGSLKLDVSKPWTRMKNGKTEVTKSPKLWLRAVRFDKGGNELRNTTRQAANNAILALFNQPVGQSATNTVNEEVAVTAGEDDLGG